MFGRTKNRLNPPERPFAHEDGCKILAADPDVVIPWSRLEYGQWRRECVCSAENWSDPAAKRVRLDPYDDPATSRHLPQCEFKDVSDPSILKALLKVTPKDRYSWVEYGGCQAGWQVADYAAESVG
jgi:hypothetical protein